MKKIINDKLHDTDKEKWNQFYHFNSTYGYHKII